MDPLQTNGYLLYAALEELRVLKELSRVKWHQHVCLQEQRLQGNVGRAPQPGHEDGWAGQAGEGPPSNLGPHADKFGAGAGSWEHGSHETCQKKGKEGWGGVYRLTGGVYPPHQPY